MHVLAKKYLKTTTKEQLLFRNTQTKLMSKLSFTEYIKERSFKLIFVSKDLQILLNK